MLTVKKNFSPLDLEVCRNSLYQTTGSDGWLLIRIRYREKKVAESLKKIMLAKIRPGNVMCAKRHPIYGIIFDCLIK